MQEKITYFPRSWYGQARMVDQPVTGRFYLDFRKQNPESYSKECAQYYPTNRMVALDAQTLHEATRVAWNLQLLLDENFLKKHPKSNILDTPKMTDFLVYHTPGTTELTAVHDRLRKDLDLLICKEVSGIERGGSQTKAYTPSWTSPWSYCDPHLSEVAKNLAIEAYSDFEPYRSCTPQGIAQEYKERIAKGDAKFDERYGNYVALFSNRQVQPPADVKVPQSMKFVNLMIGQNFLQCWLDEQGNLPVEITGNPRVGHTISINLEHIGRDDFEHNFYADIKNQCLLYRPKDWDVERDDDCNNDLYPPLSPSFTTAYKSRRTRKLYSLTKPSEANFLIMKSIRLFA